MWGWARIRTDGPSSTHMAAARLSTPCACTRKRILTQAVASCLAGADVVAREMYRLLAIGVVREVQSAMNRIDGYNSDENIHIVQAGRQTSNW